MEAFLNKWKKHLTFAALLSCFVNILQLTFPFYMFTIYRNVVISYSSFSLANISLAALLAISALTLFTYVRSRLLAFAGKDLNQMLREPIFSIMIQGSVINSGRSYQSGLNDIGVLQQYFSSPAVYALFDAPWAPFYLILIYLIHPVLGVVASIGAVLVLGLSVLQEKLVRKDLRHASAIHTNNQRFIDSFMRNTEVINGMGMIEAICDRFIAANDLVMKHQTRSSNFAGLIQAIIKPLQNVLQVFIYCLGAYYAIQQGFNVGLMVAASIIMGRSLAPLMQVTSSWQTLKRSYESYERLRFFSNQWERHRRHKRMALPAMQPAINVEQAVYAVNEQRLINQVSFQVQAGEFLAIIGPSGAGKTTLCHLLLGMWPPHSGTVSLGGKSAFSWDKEEIGAAIGYLPQEIALFPGTIAENIARLQPVDAQALNEAMTLAGVEEMVSTLEDGVKTQLEGMGGLRLSGGQKQKIALARAFYGKPKLLVLDEPSSNLDQAGEAQLLQALTYLKQQGNCTCVMVTHQLPLLRCMDKVLVLRQGKAAVFGSTKDVLAALAQAQESVRRGA